MKRPVKRHEVQQPLDADYRLIPLTRGQNAIVDLDDFDRLNKFTWFATWSKYTHSFYARRRASDRVTPTHPFMHREILNCGPREQVDHISHLTLDNRKKNLRKATHSENQHNHRIRSDNSNGFIGVHWSIREKKWKAYISVNRKRKAIGNFSTAKEAVYARDKAAKSLHGDFAVLNFPPT